VLVNHLFISAACLIAIASFLIAYSLPFDDQTLEGLVCSEPHLDIGEIRQADKVPIKWTLQNRSKSRLTLIRTLPSCSCTDVEVEDPQLEPMQTTHITGSFDSGSARGKKSVDILLEYSNQSTDEIKHLQLSATAYVKPTFTFSPDIISFTNEVHETQESRVIISSELDFSIKSTTCSTSDLDVELLNVNADGSQVVLVKYDHDPDRVFSSSDHEVLIKTDSSREPTIRIPVQIKTTDISKPKEE